MSQDRLNKVRPIGLDDALHTFADPANKKAPAVSETTGAFISLKATGL
jgi:hypothetical protein